MHIVQDELMDELDDMIAEDTEDLLPEMTGVPSLPGTLWNCFDHAADALKLQNSRAYFLRPLHMRVIGVCEWK